MILSQKILKQMIMEEITKREACCLGRISPQFYLNLSKIIGNKEKMQEFTNYLAAIWMARTKKSGKKWDDYYGEIAKDKNWASLIDKYDLERKDVDHLLALAQCRDGSGLLGQLEVDKCASKYAAPPSKEFIKKIEPGDGEEVPWTTEGPWGYDPAGPSRRAGPAQRMRTRHRREGKDRSIKSMIREELSKIDKDEIKKMISDEMEKSLKPELKKILQDELIKELGSKKTKEEVGEIAKKVIKKLYKDLSYHHPYIIDRIKV